MSDTNRKPIQRACSIAGCKLKHYGKGYCKQHYMKWYTYGNPTRKTPKNWHRLSRPSRITNLTKILNKVRFGKCWEWLGGKDSDGYGIVSVRNVSKRVTRLIGALVWGWNVSGKEVCHKCDNPACLRPTHLFLGTSAENTKDRDAKGRTSKGEKHYTTSLTTADVLEIRRLWSTGKYRQWEIANKYGLSRPQVGKIVRRGSWKHI